MELRKIKRKKPQIAGLQAMIPILVGVCIVLVVGFLIIGEAKDQVIDTEADNGAYCGSSLTFNLTCFNANSKSTTCCYNGTAPTDWNGTHTPNTTFAFNGTETTQNAMDDVPGWIPIIVITIIGALVLGLVAVLQRGKM